MLEPHGRGVVSVGWSMGSNPQNVFESFRVRVSQHAVPAWKVRLLTLVAGLIGLVVFLLLLPLILFAAVLIALWLVYVRVRLWAAGRGRGHAPDEDGRENVRVLVRDA